MSLLLLVGVGVLNEAGLCDDVSTNILCLLARLQLEYIPVEAVRWARLGTAVLFINSEKFSKSMISPDVRARLLGRPLARRSWYLMGTERSVIPDSEESEERVELVSKLKSLPRLHSEIRRLP